MWVRLLSRASYCEVINISLFNSDFDPFAPFCTVSHRSCTNLHRGALRAPFNLLKTWSAHQHHCGMLKAISALKFAQGATINDKIFCCTCGISASTCLPFNSNAYGSSILHSYRIVQLFQQQKAAALINSAHLAVMVTYWLTSSKIIFLQNHISWSSFKQNHIIWSSKIIILLPSIVRESTDIDVVKKKLLADAEAAEQSMENFGS